MVSIISIFVLLSCVIIVALGESSPEERVKYAQRSLVEAEAREEIVQHRVIVLEEQVKNLRRQLQELQETIQHDQQRDKEKLHETIKHAENNIAETPSDLGKVEDVPLAQIKSYSLVELIAAGVPLQALAQIRVQIAGDLSSFATNASEGEGKESVPNKEVDESPHTTVEKVGARAYQVPVPVTETEEESITVSDTDETTIASRVVLDLIVDDVVVVVPLSVTEEQEVPVLPADLPEYSDMTTDKMLDAVRIEFEHAWNRYLGATFESDTVAAVTGEGKRSFGMSLTLIDSLDTLYIMGFKQEFKLARDWLCANVVFGHQENINFFETTIRILGGLLSAFALTQDQCFLNKSVELADSMIFAFDTPTGIPYSTLSLNTKQTSNPAWSGHQSSVAEVGSIQLEWQYLSRITGNTTYASKVNRIIHHFHHQLTIVNVTSADYHSRPLYPKYISPTTGRTSGDVVTLGARVDSVYEYFLKVFLFNGQRCTENGDENGENCSDDDCSSSSSSSSSNSVEEQALQLYLHSVNEIMLSLVAYSTPSELTFISELHTLTNNTCINKGKMDHLVCFVPGMLALGVNSNVTRTSDEKLSQLHLQIAKELMFTCNEFYRRSPTGLSPEIVQFDTSSNEDFTVDQGAPHSLLRPETVESLFVLWRVTHDEQYREWGWNIFKAIRKYARVPAGGYSSLKDVRIKDLHHDNRKVWTNWSNDLESFFYSETMKYLYLLFSDDTVVSLDDYVFNTEGHPFPINCKV